MKIFLLEDNITLNQTICLKLEKAGYSVSSFIDGQKALNYITEGFSCFILDINVPNIDGIQILQEIRKFYNEVPIIIISASIELEDIKKSYYFGCSDFIKKPFYIDELEIKINKLCYINNDMIKFDEDSYFNVKQSLLKVDNIEKTLSPKETLLLNILLKNRNQLVSYETIQSYVWEGDYVSIDSIRSLVRRLKKFLSKPYIKSYSNRGYSFKKL